MKILVKDHLDNHVFERSGNLLPWGVRLKNGMAYFHIEKINDANAVCCNLKRDSKDYLRQMYGKTWKEKNGKMEREKSDYF